MATSRGTSIQVVENSSGYMSEELFFNDDGERAPFTATRLSTFNDKQEAQGLAKASEEVLRVGVVFSRDVVLRVPSAPHDIAMHSLITESGLLDCGASLAQ